MKVELNHAATAEDLTPPTPRLWPWARTTWSSPFRCRLGEGRLELGRAGRQGELTGRITVIGGGLVGTETAEYLLQHGCEVAIVEMLDKIAAGESETILPLIMSDFAEHNVEQHVKTRLTAITDEAWRPFAPPRTAPRSR